MKYFLYLLETVDLNFGQIRFLYMKRRIVNISNQAAVFVSQFLGGRLLLY